MLDTPVRHPPSDTEETTHRRARQRAEALQGLYIHLLVFVLINVGLFVINWITRGADGSWWFQWPAMIWALGLGSHVLAVATPLFSEEWLERKTNELAGRK